MKKILLVVCCLLFAGVHKGNAQKQLNKYPEQIYNAIQWRNIGPFRGGRSAAVTGVPGKTNLYYMGATGGGVWRTTDAGNTWENISDGFFGGSVGAVAVSEWDNNVIFVGMGEKTVRGNVSSGDGMWKSLDAGKTWQHIGLANSRHISRVRIHPKNDDIVYAAVMGDLFKSSEERGVFKSIDGGKTWKKVLFANKDAGAIDLVIDPNNPRNMFATTWNVRRTPYSLSSGGEGSSIWKSTDGGDTWANLTANEGLPKGIWGIAGVAVSHQNSDHVWAIIENENGGVYKSNDGGKTWKLLNNSRDLRQRAWYYTRIYTDTQDESIVYVMNVDYHVSKDGGKTFIGSSAPHGDHHDLWIAPENNQRMVIADDGGAQVSFDAGKNWSSYHNQPTSQFYRVVTDNHFPYRIYGAQQDNSTVRILHRSDDSFIGERDWEETAGSESAHLAVDPVNNDIVYGGSYSGFLTRVDHKNNEIRAINVWPDNPIGHGAEDFKYRFQWNFPIFFSPHETKKLYAASNHLHLTTNEGQSWELISPDLTRNDPKTLKSSGGPITQDNTGVEYYATIFAATESAYEKGLLWTGSDDGLVHVTRNGGKDWENVTPKQMLEWMMINCIEVDPFNKGGAYIVGTKYKSGDYKPYIYKTENYGKSWNLIVNGIGNEDFTRVLRADPKKKGLLYTGTERGIYVSFDDGANWQKFQLNLPMVPITDLAIKGDQLIAATQGRSFWLIDDLTPLHQTQANMENRSMVLFQPKDAYRMSGGSGAKSKTAGENHYGGLPVYFFVKDTSRSDTLNLSFYDAKKQLIKKYTTHPDDKKKEEQLKVKLGSNVFHWDLKYPSAEKVDGMILWWASLSGPTALPGNYSVVLERRKEKIEQYFNLLKDPRNKSSEQDLRQQFDFVVEVRDKMTETHLALKNVTKAREQISILEGSIDNKEKYKDLLTEAERVKKEMTEIENNLYQTKNKSGQDPLNYPIRLNNKLGHLNSLTSMGDYKPTDQEVAFKNEVIREIDAELNKLYIIFRTDIPALNQKVKENDIDMIRLNKN